MNTPAPGTLIRAARTARGWTQQDLADRLHCSRSVVSRLESGRAPLRDVATVAALARVLGIPADQLAPTDGARPPGGDDPVRRRQLLAWAATAPAWPLTPPERLEPGEALLCALRDALLHTGPCPTLPDLGPHADRWTQALLRAAERQYAAGHLRELARTWPVLLAAAHRQAAAGTPAACAVLVRVYLIAVRVLVKLERGGAPHLGMLAADRARTLAPSTGDPVLCAEAARQTAVVTRRAGWHDQAAHIALSAAADLAPVPGPHARAQRGLLLQSAAYTAAKAGDAAELRKLTDAAADLAAATPRGLLLSHGDAFGPAVVALHRISAHLAVGEVGEALRAADAVEVAALPTAERRARYWCDTAAAALAAGRRGRALEALLCAERAAPQDARARPAVLATARALLATGRTSADLRALADRLGIP